MKKTRLLTSIAALALVVCLGACEGDIYIDVGGVDIGGSSSDTEDTETSEPDESSSSGGTEPEEPGGSTDTDSESGEGGDGNTSGSGEGGDEGGSTDTDSGSGEGGEDEVTYSIEVENADKLKELEYDSALEGAQTTLELSIYLVTTPKTGEETKVKATADDVTFSDYSSEVISISGLVVTPVGEGETSITIAWANYATTSVEVKVSDVTEEPTSEFEATIYEADERYHVYADGTIEVHQVEFDDGTQETGHCIACGASGLRTDRIDYAIDSEGNAYVSKMNSTSYTDFYVVREYNGATVTGVGNPTTTSEPSSAASDGFCRNETIKFIGLPNTITDINNYAFSRCTKLEIVNLPEGVTKLGNRAFYNDQNLELPEFPSTLTTIGNEVFYQCNKFTEVAVPDTVTSLGDNVFQQCTNLVKAHIPENIESIGSNLFYKCTALTSVNIPALETIPYGYLYECSVITPDGIEFPENCAITGIGDYAFHSCKAITSLDFLPETIETFGERCFQNVPITEIDFTKFPNVTSFGSYALYGTSLVKVEFPDTVTELGTWLFSGCTSLVECSLPAGLTAIPQRLFSGCTALTTVIIPSSVTSVASYAFYNCSNLSVVYFDGDKEGWDTIISSATSSGSNTPLLSITPTYTGEYQPGEEEEDEYDAKVYEEDERYHVYEDGTIEVHQVEFDDGTQETGHCVVCGATGLKTDRIDYAIDSEGNAYVSKMNSTSYTDFYVVREYNGATVTGIGDASVTSEPSSAASDAFCKNTTIKFIGLPNTITDINNYAFDGCTALTTVNIPDGVTYIGKRAFYNDQVLNGITLPNGLKEIQYQAFCNCYVLSSIDSIPDSVTYLGEGAFRACRAITTFTLPDNVELDSNGYQFAECTSLTSVNVPTSATVIPTYFVQGCTSLTSFTIPSTVVELKDRVFQGDTALVSVVIPNSVTKIGAYMFYNCSTLESITIPDSVTSIGNATCQNCSSLETAVLGSGITGITANMFNGCTSLTTITIPESVTSIGADGFNNCTAITTVYYGGTAAEWETLSSGVSALEGITPIYYNGSGLEDDEEKEGPTYGEGTASVYSEDSRYHIYENGYIEVHQVVYDDGTTETGHCKVCGATGLRTDRIRYASADNGETYYARDIQSTSYTEFYVVCEYEGAPVTGLGTPGSTSSSSGGFNTAWQQLKFLGIPTTIDTVYPYAFYNCQYLTTLDFAQPINVGKSSFYDCHALTGTIEVAEGQTALDAYAFQECYGLTSITLPDTITSIGDSAFKSCTSLKSFEMPDSVTTISSTDQFSGCTSLEYLKVSANAASLPNRFASSCTALKTVVIPSGETSINSGSFTGDTALTTVYYGGTEEQWATKTSGVTILADLTPIYYNIN